MSASEIAEILKDQSKLDSVCQSVFETFDKNGDGFIQKDELKDAVAQFAGDSGSGEVKDEDIADALAKLDQNDDGKLDTKEFSCLVVSILEKLAGGE